MATPNVLWAGGRPDRNDVGWLLHQGIRTIVNLELLHDDKNALAHASVPDSKKYQVGYFRIRDWEPLPMVAPSLEDDRIVRLLAIITEEPAPVFIHCRCGMKRAALVVAAYQVIVEGVNADQAIHEMSRHGGAWSAADSRYILALSRRGDEIRRRVAEWRPKLLSDAQLVCADGRCSVRSGSVIGDQ